jgi:hypothetical protein
MLKKPFYKGNTNKNKTSKIREQFLPHLNNKHYNI